MVVLGYICVKNGLFVPAADFGNLEKRGGDSNGSKNCGLRTYWFRQLENHLDISLISFFPVPCSQTFQFGQMFPNFAINPQNNLRKIVLLVKVCRLPTYIEQQYNTHSCTF